MGYSSGSVSRGDGTRNGGSERSPDGQKVEIADVQAALNRLVADGYVDIDPATIGHRSAFIGAVLMTLPGARHQGSPPRISFELIPDLDTDPEAEDDEGRDHSFQGDLDPSRQGVGRREQRLLRMSLIGSATSARCAICDREYPTQFLWAAHAKKRSVCSDEERRDLGNIGMLACLFECDAMFETGLIAVGEDGRLVASPTIAQDTALAEATNGVVGRACSSFTTGNAHYFQWHRSNTFLT